MSVYLVLDDQPGTSLASNSGWGHLADWVESLAVDSPALAHLVEHGWQEDTRRLTDELRARLQDSTPADPAVIATAKNLLDLLGGSDAEVVAVTDGIGRSDDGDEADDSSDDLGAGEVQEAEEEDVDDESAHIDALAELLAGLYGDDALGIIDAMFRDDETPVQESREAWLLEAGFTGTIKDKLGRTLHYRDGKRIANPDKQTAKTKAPGKEEKHAAARAGVEAALNGERSPEKTKELVQHLASMTVPQLKALQAEYGLKASAKLKADLVAKIGEQLQGKAPPTAPSSAAPKESPKEVPKPAAPAHHEANQRLMEDAISKANLSPKQKEVYTASAKHVLGAITPAGHARIAANLKTANFHSNPMALGDAVLTEALAVPGITAEQRAKLNQHKKKMSGGMMIGGAYNLKTGSVHLDGDIGKSHAGKYATGEGIHSHHVYAHELGHAIDGPNREYSYHKEWETAWTSEISQGAVGRLVGKQAPLTDYGAARADEGFAEFSRLLYGSAVPLANIERDFPKSSAFFKSRDLWPTGRSETPDAKFPDKFDERLALDNIGSHMDTLKKPKPR